MNVNKSLENSSSNNNIIKYEPTKVLRKCLQRRKDSNKNQSLNKKGNGNLNKLAVFTKEVLFSMYVSNII